MKKIVITGPESTGKTTLTEKLSVHFQCPMVEEYARQYLEQLDRTYRQADLLEIAKGQIKMEDHYQDTNVPFLFCDTDLRVIKIWSDFKYKNVHPWILDQIMERVYHGYLLTDIDHPWVPDPLREHPESRQQLFNLYHEEIKSSGVPFTIISGAENQRFHKALKFVSGFD